MSVPRHDERANPDERTTELERGQLRLPLGLDTLRLEIPAGDGSRRTADGRVVRWRAYARCVDHAWPWWQPGAYWSEPSAMSVPTEWSEP